MIKLSITFLLDEHHSKHVMFKQASNYFNVKNNNSTVIRM